MRRILALLAPLVFASSGVTADQMSEDIVHMRAVSCDSDQCVELRYVNKFETSLCIRNTQLPFNGDLMDNSFVVTKASSGHRAQYTAIEPSFATGDDLAVLVRLLRPGATVTSRIRLADYYAMERDEFYDVEYTVRAYFCERFGRGENYILLTGRLAAFSSR